MTRNLMNKLMSVAMFCVLICVGQAFAQSTVTGGINGKVTDPQGAIVPNAKVTATNLGTNSVVTVQTNSDGEYRLSNLQPGKYAVEVTGSGFAPAKADNITVEVSTTTTIDIPLTVGTAVAEVKVTSDAPVINTSDNSAGLNINQTSINELTICLGNGGSRDGWFRVLRNLNPRYEASAVIQPGSVLRAPKHVAGLYTRNCVQGKRVELAQQLMAANKYIVPVPVAVADPASTSSPQSAQIAEAIARGDQGKRLAGRDGKGSSGKSGKPDKKKRPGIYRVRQGDSLAAIAREHDCDISTLAKHNKLRSPAYTIKPGQHLKLEGCES